MRTSRTTAGFTLIEMLVVVFIIGIMTAGVLLSVNSPAGSRAADRERAARGAHELRARCGGDADARVRARLLRKWLRVLRLRSAHATRGPASPRTMRCARAGCRAGLQLKLTVEGHDIVFKPPNQADAKKPDIMIFSNGDISAIFRADRRARGRDAQREDRGRRQGPHRSDALAGEQLVSAARGPRAALR